MKTITSIINEHRKFLIYFFISCFVTVLDILISALGEKYIIPDIINNTTIIPVISNAIGVITGFIVQYLLCSKNVYNKNNFKAFIYFFITFIIGLILAEGIIYLFRVIIFNNDNMLYELPILHFNVSISFLISKFVSIIIPFFVMYFLRKKLIGQEN